LRELKIIALAGLIAAPIINIYLATNKTLDLSHDELENAKVIDKGSIAELILSAPYRDAFTSAETHIQQLDEHFSSISEFYTFEVRLNEKNYSIESEGYFISVDPMVLEQTDSLPKRNQLGLNQIDFAGFGIDLNDHHYIKMSPDIAAKNKGMMAKIYFTLDSNTRQKHSSHSFFMCQERQWSDWVLSHITSCQFRADKFIAKVGDTTYKLGKK